MRTLTHNSSQPMERVSSAQESLKDLLKSLMQGALGLVAGRASGKSATRTRKTTDSSQVYRVDVANITQEAIDAIASQVAKTLADVGNTQVAITRAMLTATLAQLDVSALQGRAAPATAAQVAEADAELTTEEAAKLLFVSRPYMVKLLDTNMIPLAHRTVGGQRRVRKADVLRYKDLLRTRQEEAMEKMAEATDKISTYERKPSPTQSRKR